MIAYMNSRKSEKKASPILSLLLLIIIFSFFLSLTSACQLYKLEKKLDPKNAEFLSKVRYVITGKERKIFLELPDSEKQKFKEEFWKRRDPYPDTEENEFKMEYFNRIEKADKYFSGGGRPGWMSDQGRVYIIYGPPTDAFSYPMGEGPSGRCAEIWYYGQFPVEFVDWSCTGDFKLATFDLTYLNDRDLRERFWIDDSQFLREGKPGPKKGLFDFDWKVEKTVVKVDRVEGKISLEIPYGIIWFKSVESRLETILDLNLELRDSENTLIWEHKDSFEIVMKEGKLKEKYKEKYRVDIPIILEENLDKLRKGKNILHAVLKNRTGDEELKKYMEFVL